MKYDFFVPIKHFDLRDFFTSFVFFRKKHKSASQHPPTVPGINESSISSLLEAGLDYVSLSIDEMALAKESIETSFYEKILCIHSKKTWEHKILQRATPPLKKKN